MNKIDVAADRASDMILKTWKYPNFAAHSNHFICEEMSGTATTMEQLHRLTIHNLQRHIKCSKQVLGQDLRSDKWCALFMNHGGWSWGRISADLNFRLENFLLQAVSITGAPSQV